MHTQVCSHTHTDRNNILHSNSIGSCVILICGCMENIVRLVLILWKYGLFFIYVTTVIRMISG